MQVFLHMDAASFGIKADSVKAQYENLDAAKAQAEHNIETNTQRPLRIVDETGKVLVDYEK